MSHSPPPAVAEGDPKAVSGSYIDRCRTKDCKNAPWRPHGYCLVCYNSHRKELGMGFVNVPDDELRPSLLAILGDGDDDRDAALYLLATVSRAERHSPTATGQRVLERLEDGVLSRFGGKA